MCVISRTKTILPLAIALLVLSITACNAVESLITPVAITPQATETAPVPSALPSLETITPTATIKATAINSATPELTPTDANTPTSQPTMTEEPVTSTPTLTATATISASVAISCTDKSPGQVISNSRGKNIYSIHVDHLECYKTGDLLVVYAKDFAGSEFDVAVMYVLDKNSDNLLAQVIFINPNVDILTFASLRIDKNIEDVNLTLLAPIDPQFVGVTLKDNDFISISPDAKLAEGDKLKAVDLNAALPSELAFETPITMTVVEIALSRVKARVNLSAPATWPSKNRLVVLNSPGGNYEIHVKDYMLTNIRVQAGNTVQVSASGEMIVGEFVGKVGPEGADRFMLGGVFPTPIDPIYDIIPEFPHAVIMYRVQGSEKWLNYMANKRFVAESSGFLEFDINDADNSDDSGDFKVDVIVER